MEGVEFLTQQNWKPLDQIRTMPRTGTLSLLPYFISQNSHRAHLDSRGGGTTVHSSWIVGWQSHRVAECWGKDSVGALGSKWMIGETEGHPSAEDSRHRLVAMEEKWMS